MAKSDAANSAKISDAPRASRDDAASAAGPDRRRRFTATGGYTRKPPVEATRQSPPLDRLTQEPFGSSPEKAMPLPPTFDARLIRSQPLSRSVRHFVFERADGAPFLFEAGQWVSLVLPLPDGELRRAYSLASPPDASPRFELAVTHVLEGPGSSYLHGLSPGAVLKAVGPQGFFTRPLEAAGPSLFVATGTGVVPFRSMMRAAVAGQRDDALVAPLRRPHEEDILWRDELEALATTEPHVRVEFTLSRPHDAWKGRQGLRANARERAVDRARRAPARDASRVRVRPREDGRLGARAPPQGDRAAPPAGPQRAVRLSASITGR